jgi:hypothetical protein
MDDIFRGLGFRFTYMDDNLIASCNITDHLLHLQQVFWILADNGLTLNLSKCEFAVPSLDFLGDRVSSISLTPLAVRCEAIQPFPPLTDLKSLQRFLGMVNFYRRFLPGIAWTLKPLIDTHAGYPRPFLGRHCLPSGQGGSHQGSPAGTPHPGRSIVPCNGCLGHPHRSRDAAAARRRLAATVRLLQEADRHPAAVLHLHRELTAASKQSGISGFCLRGGDSFC